jgi:hypothetical protein
MRKSNFISYTDDNDISKIYSFIYNERLGGIIVKEWSEITHENLQELYFNQGMSDSDIAMKYNVSKSKVAFKRKKYGISYSNTMECVVG